MNDAHDDSDRVLFELGELQAARQRVLSAPPEHALRALSPAESSTLIEAVLRHPGAGVRAGIGVGKRRARIGDVRRTLGIAAVAAAMASLLWFLPTTSPQAVPEYLLISPASDSVMRDTPGGAEPASEMPRRYTIGRELRFVLRAERRTQSHIGVWLFTTQTGRVPNNAVRTEFTKAGNLIVTLKTGIIGYMPRPGSDTLIFALTPADEPSVADLRSEPPRSDRRLLRLKVIWQELAGEVVRKAAPGE